MSLYIHFVNVGKGSCTIIDPPSGRLTIVDIDDSRTVSATEKLSLLLKGISLSNPVDYIETHFSDRNIFRFILTHPDMDHMSGIQELFNRRNVLNFWDIKNSKEMSDWERSPYNKEDWDFYQKLRCGSSPRVLNNIRGSNGQYWSDDFLEVLHPHADLENLAEDQDDYDHLSHVIKISHAGRSVLIGGDVTKDALGHIHQDDSVDQSANVLLAPGHGSENHIHEEAIDSMKHRLTVISVAENVDYAKDYYKKFGLVLSTKYFGNIIMQINDYGEILFRTQCNDYSDQWYKLNL